MHNSTNVCLGEHIRNYYRERFDQEFFITTRGFITYRILDGQLIIDDFYLERNSRRGLYCKRFIEQLQTRIIDAGIDLHTLVGFVSLEANNGSRIESLFNYYGMIKDNEHSQPNYIKYTKPIR